MFESFTEMLGVSVAIIAVVGGFLIAGWAIYQGNRTKRLMIEKGVYRQDAETDNRFSLRYNLRRGILLLAMGIAFLFVNYMPNGPEAWPFTFVGALLCLLGLAFLILALAFRKRT